MYNIKKIHISTRGYHTNNDWKGLLVVRVILAFFFLTNTSLSLPAAVDSGCRGEVSGIPHRESLPAESPWISSLWKGSRRPKKNRVTGGQIRSWSTGRRIGDSGGKDKLTSHKPDTPNLTKNTWKHSIHQSTFLFTIGFPPTPLFLSLK